MQPSAVLSIFSSTRLGTRLSIPPPFFFFSRIPTTLSLSCRFSELLKWILWFWFPPLNCNRNLDATCWIVTGLRDNRTLDAESPNYDFKMWVCNTKATRDSWKLPTSWLFSGEGAGAARSCDHRACRFLAEWNNQHAYNLKASERQREAICLLALRPISWLVLGLLCITAPFCA